MASYKDTFKDVDVTEEKDKFGKPIDLVDKGVNSLKELAPAPAKAEAPIPEQQEAPPVEQEAPPVEPVQDEGSLGGMFDLSGVPEDEPTLMDSFDLSGVPEDAPTLEDSFDLSNVPEPEAPVRPRPPDLIAQAKERFPNWPVLTDEEKVQFNEMGRTILDPKQTDRLNGVKTPEQIEHDRFVGLMLPEGIEPGSYSANDIPDNDELYGIVLDYANKRWGSEEIEGLSKTEVTTKFLESRRAVAMAGNSWSGLWEAAWLYDRAEDPDTILAAGKAYVAYSQMSGILSDETSWSEAGDATWDVVSSIALDPMNIVTLGVGKAMGGVAMKSGIKTLESYVQKTILQKTSEGASRAAIQAASTKIYREAGLIASTELSKNVLRFSTQMASTTGGRRLLTKYGLAEVAGTTVADAIANSGMEFLYQKGLVQTGVQYEVNQNSVGLAALASLMMGGVSAGLVANRGRSGTALVDQVVQTGSPKDVAEALKKSIKDYFVDGDYGLSDETSWASKVAGGEELNVRDSDFFIKLLTGISEPDGTVKFQGIGEILSENGFYYHPRNEDDTFSNWIADFITEELDADDVNGIVRMFEESAGVKMTGLEDMTPKTFGDAFAKKISDVATVMGQVGNVARRQSLELEDVDLDVFTRDALSQGLISPKTRGDKVADKLGTKFTNAISAGQNRFIRMLVTHPSTSYLNVAGWAASSALGTANDLTRGSMFLGTAAIQRALGKTEGVVTRLGSLGAADENARVGEALVSAVINRVKYVLDPDMTSAAFQSAIAKGGPAISKLARVQSGGVDVSRSMNSMLDSSALGRAGDSFIEWRQTMTFVDAQDTFTKSQEYLYQMDKNLRIAYGKDYNKFFTAETAGKEMATKKFREIQERSAASVAEHTFSQSYKGTSILGEIAGAIEDARSIPGIGMLVPFGRFFNNTIDFTAKNTPILNVVLKGVFNKYPNKTYGELNVAGGIAGGLVYALMGDQQDKRRRGLDMYATDVANEDVSFEYMYPISAFMAAARLLSYKDEEDSPPPELVARVFKDFGGGGLTRNLTTTGGAVIDAAAALFAWDLEKTWSKVGDVGSDIGAQAIGGFTRTFEPEDTILGLMTGTELRPQNVKDGNAFVGKSLAYVSNLTELLTGGPMNDPAVSSVEGERPPALSKPFGSKQVLLTSSLRLMNLIEYDTWDNDAAYAVSKYAAGAGNEYERMFFQELEPIAKNLMADKTFLSWSVTDQRAEWESRVALIGERARTRLAYEYTGEQSTFYEQYKLTGSNSIFDIREGIEAIGSKGTIGELDDYEIELLSSYLSNKSSIEAYDRPRTSVPN